MHSRQQPWHGRALFLALVALGSSALGCSSSSSEQPPPREPAPQVPAAPASWLPDDTAAGVKDARLKALLLEHFEAELRADPLWASDLGIRDLDDQLPDRSRKAVSAWRLEQARALEVALAIPDAALSDDDKLTKQLFVEAQRARIASFVCRSELWSVDARQNPLVELNRLPELADLSDLRGARMLLERYRKVPELVDADIEHLRFGLSLELVSSRASIARVVKQYRTELAKPIKDWPLHAAADKLGRALPADARSELAVELRREVEERIRPAMARYADFLQRELMPKARGAEREGLHGLSLGEACYTANIKRHTTLDYSAEQLHELGLAELKKIHAEIKLLGEKQFKTSELVAIQAKLRDDPAMSFSTAEEVQTAAEVALGRAQALVSKVVATAPKAPCVVRPIPDYEAPFSPIAYYRPPAPDGSKPGEYFINLHLPTTRPRYEAEVLAFHEAIPGHHLQIALSQELPAVPAFRKHAYNTAYVEGWALYTERLADELGLYTSDLSRLGMLSFDTWRAARLVVDTGLHAKGWTRKQAEDFLYANTLLARGNVENEVDRYISWPGQALAYKVGQLKILALRQAAQQALGEAFVLTEFHAVVLGAGPLPLPVLEARVQAWVATKGGAAKPPPAPVPAVD